VRIVGGDWRGRSLKAPAGRDTRPTTDRVRESIFNILAHGSLAGVLENAHVLDVYAGSGAMGFEALSRGATHATFIEKDRTAQNIIQQNACTFRVARDIVVLPLDGTKLPSPPMKAKAPFNVVFMDAPYGQGMTSIALLGLRAKGWLAQDAALIIELGEKESCVIPPAFEVMDDRAFGITRVLFLCLSTPTE